MHSPCNHYTRSSGQFDQLDILNLSVLTALSRQPYERPCSLCPIDRQSFAQRCSNDSGIGDKANVDHIDFEVRLILRYI